MSEIKKFDEMNETLDEMFGAIPYPDLIPDSDPDIEKAVDVVPLWKQSEEIQKCVRDRWAVEKCGKPYTECDGFERKYLKSQGLMMGIVFSIEE